MMTMKVDAAWDTSDKATHLRAGKHAFFADEPASIGGTDKGPNPIQYMLGGLAGCFIAMGKMVAGEMGLKLDRIAVKIEGDINPLGLQGKDPAVRPGCLEIRLVVEVATAEPREKIAKWLEVSESRCPVRDCIVHETPVKVVLK